ncbi:MAG: M48 family metallopeptidase [Steroidobacteraceae bacterium]
MNFYERQSAARRSTRRLLVAFILSMLAVTAALSLVIFSVLGATIGDPLGVVTLPDPAPLRFMAASPGAAIVIVLLIAAVMFGASLYKTMTLRAGGSVVATSLGGTRVERGVADPLQQRLLNIVEEMSIAAGVPMPEIFVLVDEPGINAFAAGHTPANAAIAVTQGALERLRRDELQGVIAHEFSHILNGDMQLNIRMLGWLFGLLALVIVGRTVLRVSHRSRNGKSTAAILVVALALVVVGQIGLLFARILQAAVSRQRERLADASAVQFTRDTQGLKQALVKIGASSAGARLATPAAEEVAHMLFAPGLSRMFATHPPLIERIRALDPGFDPAEIERARMEFATARDAGTAAVEKPAAPAAASALAGAVASIAAPVAARAELIADQVGDPQTVHIERADELRHALPIDLARSLTLPIEAQTLLLGMLLDSDAGRRGAQLHALAGHFDDGAIAAIAAAAAAGARLPAFMRLPVITLAFPALRRLPRTARERLQHALHDLIMADGSISVFEFSLSTVLQLTLADELGATVPHGRLRLGDVSGDLAVLFAVLAEQGASNRDDARRAYEAGIARLLPRQRPPFQPPRNWPPLAEQALLRLRRLDPFAKEMLIEALVLTIAHDDTLSVAEAELLRAICLTLQCPLPPLLPRVSLAGAR